MDTSTRENIKKVIRLTPLIQQKLGSAYRSVNDKDKWLYNNQIRALMIIGNRRKITSSELGATLYMKKGSVTSLVDGLIEKELVIRENDKQDRRKIWLRLSEKGIAYRAEKYPLLQQELYKVLEVLPKEDLDDFFQGVEKVINVLLKL